MHILSKLLLAACLAASAPASAAPAGLCDTIAHSFAATLAGPVTQKPVGAKTCMVSVGTFASMSVGVNVSVFSGSAATLKTLRAYVKEPSQAEPMLGDGAYSILNRGGGGMLPQFTINAAKSGKWIIVEIRRRDGFAATDLAKARTGAKAFLDTL
jgi:hypothetical protein